MLDKVINVGLIVNPMNWIIVVLMVLLGSMMTQYLFQSANQDN
jgi:hypothetical protein